LERTTALPLNDAMQQQLAMNLLRAAASVSGMTLASRITGFIRDTLLAVLFGAGLTMDAFVVAFRIPNLLRRLFAEGAFSQAFVPVIGDYRNRKGEEATRELAAKVLAALAVAPHLERPVMALAWAVFFGGLLQLAFQIPFLKHIGMLVRPRSACRSRR